METIHAIPKIKVICSVVFATSSNLQPVPAGGVALQPLHVAGGVPGGQSRVLAGSFLAPPPPGVPENVHVWAPIGQPRHASIIHCSCFIRYHLYKFKPQMSI